MGSVGEGIHCWKEDKTEAFQLHNPGLLLKYALEIFTEFPHAVSL